MILHAHSHNRALEIIPNGTEGVFLLQMDTNGTCLSDSWHENIEQAQAQAAFEFGVETQEWTKVNAEPESV